MLPTFVMIVLALVWAVIVASRLPRTGMDDADAEDHGPVDLRQIKRVGSEENRAA